MNGPIVCKYVWEKTEIHRNIDMNFEVFSHFQPCFFCTASLPPQRRIQSMLGVVLQVISAETTTKAAKKLPMRVLAKI